MVTPEPTLETDRLILRPPVAADFEPWAAFAADEETMRHLGGAQPRSVAWRGICSVTGAWAIRGHSMFSVIEKATGRWVGRLGPWQPEGWPGAEVGWGIVRDCWGQGYASEGATAAIDYAFDELGWDEVIHCIEPANLNSQKVAKRLGSTYLRDDWLPVPYDDHPVGIWGQSRAQWKARPR
ncbi:MAG: family N-acetyltransferase [Phenylobacterium sp.]|nr:family N-acetyltransferase [Phenylobacterium sp.]